jgi:hypothetical protein
MSDEIIISLEDIESGLQNARKEGRDTVLDEVIALLDDIYERKYDPRSCNRTDEGGMYNDGELSLISEIKEEISKLRQAGE